MGSKSSEFRRLLISDRLEFLLEAHDGLSAKIVEEAGFQGIWGSGLSISAAMGVRDSNEASWTQVLEVVEFMSDATSIPILLDADTGYGNFNNMRRLVRKLEQRGVAAVCIEDKLYPKTNSFIGGEKQPLADIDEFCGKIKAAKDVQVDSDFAVVARIESFIAGWGLAEALHRAESYHSAGADAILVHSKLPRPDEILAFMSEWQQTCPVLIVPTTYYSTPTQVFQEVGICMAIWANHLVRASVAAMQRVAAKIQEERSLLTAEDEVVSVSEIFRLQGVDELQEAERTYLPSRQERGRAIVLAASRGSDLGSLTEDKPKVMLPVKGRPLLQRLMDHFNGVGIKDVLVVAGYKHDTIVAPGAKIVINEDYAETKELSSLLTATGSLDGPVVVSYGDILFKKYILLNLLNEPGDIVIVVDADRSRTHVPTRYTDLVRTSRPHVSDYLEEPVTLLEMDPTMSPEHADGEWIGLMKLSPHGSQAVQAALHGLQSQAQFGDLRMKDLFGFLLSTGQEIRVVYTHGHWLDIDDLEILSQAMEF